MKITHIINPFTGSEEHMAIQDITLQSIKTAKEIANDLEIELFAVYDKGDVNVVPEFIQHKCELQTSVLDFNTNLKNRKLPVLREIIECAEKNTNADYYIYTNIDIGLQPNFYKIIFELIKDGYDAFAINRRRVSEKYNSINHLEAIYAEVGKMHSGYDCFVFKRELISKFKLGNVCLGIPFVDSVFLFNLMSYAENFKLFTDKHLTFHIGFDLVKIWGSELFLKHNKLEYLKILNQLSSDIELKNVPGSGLPFFKRHLKWLMNPTLHYPTLAKVDFKKWGSIRYKQTTTKQKGYLEWLQKKIKLDD